MCWPCGGVRFDARWVSRDLGLPSAVEDGALIYLIEIDGFTRVMIEVREDATTSTVRNTIPLALRWRHALLEAQGPWTGGGTTYLMEDMVRRHDAGTSYASLAEMCNRTIEGHVREWLQYLDEFEAARPTFKTMGDFYLWKSEANQFALDHARYLLRHFPPDPADCDGPEKEAGRDQRINRLLTAALEEIRAGESPFGRDFPVSRERMIRALRTWGASRTHTLIREHQRD
jgi:hypothetical protein